MDLRQAWELAEKLVAEHGLKGWQVALDRAKARAGACHFGRKEISLSAPLTRLHTAEEVRDTILHEIAHALVGPRHGHDKVWRAQARAIGCTAMRCVPTETARVPGRWVGTCALGHRVERHRRPEKPTSCAECGPRFDVAHLFDWRYDGRRAPMHPNYVAALRALTRGGLDVSRALGVGHRVRISAQGHFAGVTGQIVKRGRTRYHVRVPGATISVPFSFVEPITLAEEYGAVARRAT